MDIKDIVNRDLASKYKKDKRVIEQITRSPFKFVNRVIRDPKDDRAVRIKYFGVFVQKDNSNKSYKYNYMSEVLLQNITDVFVVMNSMLGFQLKHVKTAKRIIEEARDTKDYDKLKMIYDAYMEYEK